MPILTTQSKNDRAKNALGMTSAVGRRIPAKEQFIQICRQTGADSFAIGLSG
jgi:hypothetical protein